jgi:hypothetical protein
MLGVGSDKFLLPPKSQSYAQVMKNYKNYLIAALITILGLSLAIQPSQGATSSSSSKAIEYDNCLKFYNNNKVGQGAPDLNGYPELFTFHLQMCRKYKP